MDIFHYPLEHAESDPSISLAIHPLKSLTHIPLPYIFSHTLANQLVLLIFKESSILFIINTENLLELVLIIETAII